jgi:hypothetical protein
MNFKCKECNKLYKSYQSLWNHNYKYHNKDSTKITPKSTKSPPKSTKNIQDVADEIHSKYLCEYCNSYFSRSDSLTRHYNRCKVKIKSDNNKDEVISKLNNKVSEIQQQLSSLLKHCKVHPKTLQKINKNLLANNNSYNSGNINNGTINNNNTYNIVKFGSENIDELLSKSELFNILNQRYLSIEKSIQTVHFNDKYPNHKNILITNLRDNIAYIYDGKQYSAIPKTQALNELIDIHTENIEVSLTNYREKLPSKTVEILEKLLEKIRDDNTPFVDGVNEKNYKNYKSYKINEIKLMVYNESDKNKSLININCDVPLKETDKSIEV